MAEEEKKTALQQLQAFNPAKIARTEDLGSALGFTSAVPVALGIVQLFRQISEEALAELPEQIQKLVQSQAEVCLKTIQDIRRFDPARANNAANERQALIDQLKHKHYEAMVSLAPVLAFEANRERDLSSTERQAQALLQSAQTTSDEIAGLKQQSESIIDDVRKLAAKAGVATQANYFDEQAGEYAKEAAKWQTRTYQTAGALAGFALLTWMVGYYVEPKSAYQAVQWGLSKILIFSTIAFILFFSSRTLMANRHNEVVNAIGTTRSERSMRLLMRPQPTRQGR